MGQAARTSLPFKYYHHSTNIHESICIRTNTGLTNLSMAKRKKSFEMTEEEKQAEKEMNEKLLLLKGMAFLIAGIAFITTNQ